ncbi:MAG: acyl carrier protein [Verrucomicrobia bacterium]|nr:acyl carrier protein [Verrucomicrobiota bacterium]
MSIEAKLKRIVCETLKIDESRYRDDLAAGDIPEWDSLGHVNLLMVVEKSFNVAFEIGDAIDIESVEDLIAVLEKYVGGLHCKSSEAV